MKEPLPRRAGILQAKLWREDRAAQLVEFAVALPLLILFVVGIFDFSSAFTLKQKLTNIARDAARAAAADPVTDLQNAKTLPVSVSDAFRVINTYLVANNISNCGIDTTTPVPSAAEWTYRGTFCSSGTLTVVINRGYTFPAQNTVKPPDVNCTSQAPVPEVVTVVSTCISIQYPYQWQFGRVASLLGPSATLPTTITATAVAMNEN